MELLFFLASFGITSILVYGKIFQPLRDRIKIDFFKNLLACALCTGFWVSLGLSFYFVGFSPIKNFLYATAGAGTAWLLCGITQLVQWSKALVESITLSKVNHP
jgi:hypothetical protein